MMEVERLLTLYEGVEVCWRRAQSRLVYFDLSITNLESLARLVHWCGAANIRMDVQSRSKWDYNAADPKFLRFQVRIREHDPAPIDPPSTLQIFGAFLAWDLKSRRILEREEANRLLDAWNCVH